MYTALLLLAVCGLLQAADWGYDNDSDKTKGPAHWGDEFSQCNGKRQSPIAIWKNVAKVNTNLTKTPLTLDEGYNGEVKEGSFEISNNGHTFTVALKDAASHQMHVTGGGLSAEYTLKQFHFHWAKGNHEGSEHVFGHEERPLEVHFVHTKNDMEVSDALEKPDGLAVLGVAFKMGKESDRNTELDKLVRHLNEIRFKDTSAEISESLKLSSFMPKNRQDFYRYEGSLTTPPCSEAVIWTLFQDAPVVSERQLHEFRLLFSGTADDSSAHPVDYNFRPVQPLHKRKVFVTNEKMLKYLDDEPKPKPEPEPEPKPQPRPEPTPKSASVVISYGFLITLPAVVRLLL